jgi:LPXTG-motif cell wall-anchored protein
MLTHEVRLMGTGASSSGPGVVFGLFATMALVAGLVAWRGRREAGHLRGRRRRR